MTGNQAQIDMAREECRDAIRQAISDAESAAHDLAGAQQHKEADISRYEAFNAIDKLAALASEPAAPRLMWTKCHFDGPVPDGYTDWYDFINSPLKKGAYIRSLGYRVPTTASDV